MPDPIADYDKAADGFAEALAGCDDPTVQTPCTEWKAQDVIDHVLEGTAYFTGLFGGTVPELDEGTPVVERYAALRAALVAAISAPGAAERMVPSPIGGELPAGVMFGIFTTDTLLHTWDLAAAQSGFGTVGLDAELLERSWQNALPLDEVIRGPGIFGPKVDVGTDAPRDVQALAFFGRDART